MGIDHGGLHSFAPDSLYPTQRTATVLEVKAVAARFVRWLFLALFDNGGKPRHFRSGAPPKA